MSRGDGSTYVLYCNIPFLVFLSQSEMDEHILNRALEGKETLAKIGTLEAFSLFYRTESYLSGC